MKAKAKTKRSAAYFFGNQTAQFIFSKGSLVKPVV